jgi:sugar lactone lactonase YvrE/microcystin-dependent protein
MASTIIASSITASTIATSTLSAYTVLVNGNTTLGGAPGSNNVVTTLAGSGAPTPFSNSIGAAASFYNPYSVAVAPDGTIYVADTANHRIRKVTPEGVVTTLAGDGNGRWVDGIGSGASFNSPKGVAIGSDGNIYVGDTGNNRIRKVTPDGVVTTVAGSGTAGFLDGTGSAATFNSPIGVAVAPDGNIYVADYTNNRIRKVTPGGVVTTLAGSGLYGSANGMGSAASFGKPCALAIGPDGNIYVADTDNHLIRKVTPQGEVATIAGGSTIFKFPQGITLDSLGNIYLADTANQRISKVTNGVVTTLVGSGSAAFADGIGTAASFSNPCGVAIGSDGNIYVADSNNNRIRKIDSGLASVNITGNAYVANYLTTGGSVNVNRDLDVSGNTDLRGGVNAYGNMIVQGDIQTLGVFRGNGSGLTNLPNSGNSASFSNLTAPFIYNSSLRTSSIMASTIIASSITASTIATSTLSAYTVLVNGDTTLGGVPGPNNVVTTLAGNDTHGFADGIGTAASFKNPYGIAIGPDGNIYVADGDNNRIRKVTLGGIVTTVAGSGSAAFADGIGTAASFSNPYGIAIGPDGTIYVADTNNHRIRKMIYNGTAWVVTTLAGSGSTGNTDSTGTAALFNSPEGIALAPDGTIYVADTGNSRIRKMIYNGTAWVVTRLAGNTSAFPADGTGTNATFSFPKGIAIGPDGNIYVADTSNHIIRKVTPQGVVTRVAGSPIAESGNGTKLNQPTGIAVAADGSIYIGDRNNNRICKITFPTGTNLDAGVVTSFAGNETYAFADGTATAASFRNPYGIAIGPDGGIYVGDTGSNRIRKINSGLSSVNIRGNIYVDNYLTAGGSVNVNRDLNVNGNTDLRGNLTVGGVFNIIPSGSLMMYVSTTPPNGWLLCNGSPVSRITYSALFAIIGTTYGTGDGSTTFNLPDTRGRTPIGTGTGSSLTARTLGQTGGAETHTLTTNEMPSHSHSGTTATDGVHSHGINDPGHSHVYTRPRTQNLGFGNFGNVTDGMSDFNTTTSVTNITINNSVGHTHTFNTNATGSGAAHNNMQPFLVVNYIIKI